MEETVRKIDGGRKRDPECGDREDKDKIKKHEEVQMPLCMVIDKVSDTMKAEVLRYMQSFKISPADMCIILERVLSNVKDLKMLQYAALYHADKEGRHESGKEN